MPLSPPQNTQFSTIYAQKKKKIRKSKMSTIPEFSYSILHHLCSTIKRNTKRFLGFGSNIFLSSDKASVSTFLHGMTVVQRSLLFHFTYGPESVAGLSHGSSEIDQLRECYTSFLAIQSREYVQRKKKPRIKQWG